jgi:hypothetical protein
VSEREEHDAGGCLGCLFALIVIAAVVAGLISLAALIDPFNWMPPVEEIWAECDDDYKTERDECALENRFPGFWVHAVVNLVYTAVAGGLVLGFGAAVVDFRGKREERFSGPAAAEEHRTAFGIAVGAGAALLVVALIPIVVAVL